MSDVPGKGSTAPMNARATQMSASAVPSTLESPQDPPKDPPKLDTTERMEDVPTEKGERLVILDEIRGPAVLQAGATRDGSASQVALSDLKDTIEDSQPHRSGPRTLMSPAVVDPSAPKAAAHVQDPSPEEAVTFAPPIPIAQGHVFGNVHGSAAPPAYGAREQQGLAQFALAQGGNGAQGAARRPMSTTTIVLIVGGVLVALFVIGGIVTLPVAGFA